MLTPLAGQRYSLRRRLLLLVGGPVLLVVVIAAIVNFAFASYHVGKTYDGEMIHLANVLLQLTEHEILEGDDPSIELGAERVELSQHHEKFIVFRIWYKGRIVTQSSIADILRLGPLPANFTQHTVHGHHWRFFSYTDAKTGITVDIGQRADVRHEVIDQIFYSFAAAILLLIPLCMALVWIGTTRGLRPLVGLSGAVDQRHEFDLAPIDFSPVAAEVAPLLAALNGLLARLGDALRRERELTDNAAHELRTPLAAIRMNIQVLLRRGQLEEGDRDLLENILQGLDRVVAMAGQLLELSRLDHGADASQPVDLSAVAKQAATDAEQAAHGAALTFSAAIEGGLWISGNQLALALMLRNLLDNAIKFTPAGGHVEIVLGRFDMTILLTITDSGPGIPDLHKDRVFERFYRVEKNLKTGSGVGLALVRRTVDDHGARITLRDALPHGLIVEIIFPALSHTYSSA